MDVLLLYRHNCALTGTDRSREKGEYIKNNKPERFPSLRADREDVIVVVVHPAPLMDA